MAQSGEARVAEQQLVEPLLLRDHNNDSVQSDGDDVDNVDNVDCSLLDQLDELRLLQESRITSGNDDDDDNDGDAPTVWGLFFYRALYFLNGLSASTWGRFGVIYYNEVANLNPEQIGLLQGITPLISFVMMPCWGALADYCASRKVVYLFCKGTGTLCLMALYLLQRQGHGSRNASFHLILICISGMSFFRASGVLDAFVLDYLGPSHRGLYGTIRLWTAVSWGLGAVLMGWMTDVFGFAVNFLLFGTMMCTMMLVVGFGLPARSKKEQIRYDDQRNRGNITTSQEGSATIAPTASRRPKLGVLVKALCRVPVFLWLFQVVVIGSGMALVDSFLFVYLQNDLHASTELCGFTVGITVLFELPIFHYSQYLLQTVGHDALFAVSMTAYVIRAFGYTVLTQSTVYWILPLEVLHGITFACMWIASIDFSAIVAPEEWSTTVQTILSASFACFGNVVGSILGGWVMQQYSVEIMYRGMGWIVCGTLVVHLFLWLGCRRGHGSFLQSIDDQVMDNDNRFDDDIDDVEEPQEAEAGRDCLPDVEDEYRTGVSNNKGDSES